MTTATLPRFTIDAAAFRALVDAVSPAARNGFLGVPMLRLTAADDGRLTAAADDLTHGVDAWAEADVARAGEAVVSHDVLDALLARVDGPLACAATAKGLDVAAAGTAATVRTLPADQPSRFPAVEPLHGGVDLDAAALARAIERCIQATDKPGSPKPHLEGVHVAVRRGDLLASASDGYRAAVAAVAPLDARFWAEDGYTVPASALKTLHRLLRGVPAGEAVRVGPSVTKGRLVVTGPSWRFSGALLHGAFPDAPRLVAEATARAATVATVETAALNRAVALAVAFAPAFQGDDRRSRRVALALSGAGIAVSAAGPDLGEVRRDVPAAIDGPEVAANLDARYLRDALAVCPATVALRVAAPNLPVLLLDPDGPDRFLISPMV